MAPAPEPLDEAVRSRLKDQRTADTAAETRLRSELHRLGLRFRKHRRVLSGVRRVHDIVFGPTRVIVDVHGCFWHGCPEHFVPPKHNAQFWAEKIEANRQRDSDTERRLEAEGWLLITVWEHENPTEAAKRVRDVVVGRPNRR